MKHYSLSKVEIFGGKNSEMDGFVVLCSMFPGFLKF